MAVPVVAETAGLPEPEGLALARRIYG
jgi:hypothetical protein